MGDLFHPPGGEAIPAIVPDPLADWVVFRRLKAEPDLLRWSLPTPDDGETVSGSRMAEWAWNALSVLIRMWNSRDDGRGKIGEWIRLARGAIEDLGRALTEKNPDTARAFWGSLERLLPHPDRTIHLRETIAAVYSARLKLLPRGEEEERARLVSNLGAALSSLGRREEALEATEEAVGIYRELARRNPDAFLPDLARSLGLRGSILQGMNRHEEAAESLVEGLRVILPFVQALPEAFGGLVGWLLQLYVESAQAAGVEPDEELLSAMRALGVG